MMTGVRKSGVIPVIPILSTAYPQYPPYPPCCGSKAGAGDDVEAKVSMKMSNMSLNEKVEEKEGTTQQQKQ